MGPPLDPTVYKTILRLLLLSWRHDAIAEHCHVTARAVYKIEANYHAYGCPGRPRIMRLGGPRKITQHAGELLLQHLDIEPWMILSEMAWFLWEETGIDIHKSTVSRFLKKAKWSDKKGERRSKN